jgi:hypothetical protein
MCWVFSIDDVEFWQIWGGPILVGESRRVLSEIVVVDFEDFGVIVFGAKTKVMEFASVA